MKLKQYESFKITLNNDDDSLVKEKIDKNINMNKRGRFIYIGKFNKNGYLKISSELF